MTCVRFGSMTAHPAWDATIEKSASYASLRLSRPVISSSDFGSFASASAFAFVMRFCV